MSKDQLTEARQKTSSLLGFFKEIFAGNLFQMLMRVYTKRKEIIKKLEELYELLSKSTPAD